LKDLLTCTELDKRDASTFAQLFSLLETSVSIKDKTPLLADFTTLKLLLDLEIWFTAPTLPPTETEFAELTPVPHTANKSSPLARTSTLTTQLA
jgi:hypothetical protein